MGKQNDPSLVVCGAACEIRYARDSRDRMPAKEFLDSLDDRGRAKMHALFYRMADSGRINNDKKFKKLEGGIWEFKDYQTRVLCFMSGETWFLTNGCKKKSLKTRRTDIERAERIMKEHRDQMGNNRRGKQS